MILFNTWQTNISAYLVTIVIFQQFYKLAVKNAIKDGAATILLQIIATLSVLFVIPFYRISFPNEIKFYILLFFACIFYALNDRLQTTVRKNLPVSEYTILSQSYRIFLFLIGIFIFKESFILNKVIGLALVLFANVLIVYEEGKFVINKNVWLTLLAMVTFATAISIDVGISSQFNLPIYIALTLFVPALFIAGAEKIKLKSVASEFKKGSRLLYLITGVSWSFAIIFSLQAYQLGDITTQIPIRGAGVLANVLVAYLFFNEKSNLFKKVIAAILIIFGVYITSL